MITRKAYEKKFWIFKVWYGIAGQRKEWSLSAGIAWRKNLYACKWGCALCINLIFVYFNIGLEWSFRDR